MRESALVCHTFAHTDDEVAYGLAGADAEGNVTTLHSVILGGKSQSVQCFGQKSCSQKPSA